MLSLALIWIFLLRAISTTLPNVTPACAITEMAPSDMYEWSVRIRVDRNALGGAFTIAVFLLPPEAAKSENQSSIIPSKPSQWADSPSYVGQVAVGPTTLRATSGDEQPLMIQGFVLLDDALADVLDRTDLETVIPYLKSLLVWKASSPRKMGAESLDEEYDLDNLPSLKMTVMSTKVEDASGPLSEPQPAVPHPTLTEGKKGGIASGQ